MPGSVVNTRSSFAAAISVPSATTTMPGVLRIADADSAAVVDVNPRRAARRIHQRVEQWPVGDRIGHRHRLGLPVRRCDRAGVQMIAADDDRR